MWGIHDFITLLHKICHLCKTICTQSYLTRDMMGSDNSHLLVELDTIFFKWWQQQSRTTDVSVILFFLMYIDKAMYW